MALGGNWEFIRSRRSRNEIALWMKVGANRNMNCRLLRKM